jgi:hypothetical protein
MSMRFSPNDPVPQPGFWSGLWRRARALPIKAIPPLWSKPSGGMTLLTLKQRPRFAGLVTGPSGTGYVVEEAAFNATTGVTSLLAGGRSVAATEYNLATNVPVGSAVDVHHTEAGDWRFEYIRGGNVTGCGAVNYYVCVTACHDGGEVTVVASVRGVTVGTCTITVSTHTTPNAGTGCCLLSLSGIEDGDPIVFTYSLAPYTDATETITATCAGGTVTHDFMDTVTEVCHCCQTAPMPRTLYITTVYGTFPMTFGLTGFSSWSTGSLTVTEPTALVAHTNCAANVDRLPEGASIVVSYTTGCDGSGNWTVSKSSNYWTHTVWTFDAIFLVCRVAFFSKYLTPVVTAASTGITGTGTASCDPCAVSFTSAITGTPTVVAFDETVTISA